jgi:hypothetical protein
MKNQMMIRLSFSTAIAIATAVATYKVCAYPADYKCNDHWMACQVLPACPTQTGECVYCTNSLDFRHQCQENSGWHCVQDMTQWGEPNGCGYLFQGYCGANKTCLGYVSTTECGRETCHNEPPPG